MVARPWSSSRLSCGERLLLRCEGNNTNSFPTTQGKDPSSRDRRQKRVSSGCGRESRASFGVETTGSSAFSKTSLNIRRFTVHVLMKPGLENFEHYFTSMWNECNCAVIWAFFGIAFLWDWNENWPFPALLECVAIPFSRGSSWSRNQTGFPTLKADSLPSEPPKIYNFPSV